MIVGCPSFRVHVLHVQCPSGNVSFVLMWLQACLCMSGILFIMTQSLHTSNLQIVQCHGCSSCRLKLLVEHMSQCQFPLVSLYTVWGSAGIRGWLCIVSRRPLKQSLHRSKLQGLQ